MPLLRPAKVYIFAWLPIQTEGPLISAGERLAGIILQKYRDRNTIELKAFRGAQDLPPGPLTRGEGWSR
jgi:hypothetical protein